MKNFGERHLSCQHFGFGWFIGTHRIFVTFFFFLLLKKVEIDDGLITESKRRLCVCVKSKAVINLDGLFGAAGQQNDKRRYTAPLKRNPTSRRTDILHVRPFFLVVVGTIIHHLGLVYSSLRYIAPRREWCMRLTGPHKKKRKKKEIRRWIDFYSFLRRNCLLRLGMFYPSAFSSFFLLSCVYYLKIAIDLIFRPFFFFFLMDDVAAAVGFFF